MTAKHTPGPWLIIAKPGEFNQSFWIGPERFHSICEVRNGADDEEYGGPERCEANAHLIVAAPDMLKLLRDLSEIDGSSANVASAEVLAARVRAAVQPVVAKAEGRTP